MTSTSHTQVEEGTVSASPERSQYLFNQLQQNNYSQTDRLFAWLMSAQWLIGIVIAFVVSPRTWAGSLSAPHPHVYAAVLLGGAITALPVWLAWRRPGHALTRHAVAAGQLMMSGLLIHLTGGRIETHFHIFASLAILSFYHDWRVLLTAATVTAVDHLVRSIVWPESIFGVVTTSEWRVVEHAAWVVIEVAFLTIACRNARRERHTMAAQQAKLEAAQTHTEQLLEDLQQQKHEAEHNEREATELAERVEHQRGQLSASVDRMLVEMQHFAEGDLTVRVATDRDDAIGRLFDGFNRAVAQVQQAIERVAETVAIAASSSTQIALSSDELTAGTQEQSAQANEVAAAVEEMTRTILENAESATQAAELAQANGQTAQEGGRIMSETIGKIRDLADVVGQSAQTVERLGASSQEIGQIVETIEEIADQTNLLALNAAIEAARAGEQGRGFAVVADEVRKLAERTTGATDEIARMIGQIQEETGAAVEAMQRGTKEVETGLQLADAADASLRQIVTGTQEAVDRISQIAAATEEQSATSEEIAQSIAAISAVSQQAAQGVNQIAGTAATLSRHTDDLQQLIAVFRFETKEAARDHGDGRSGPAPVASPGGDGATTLR